MKGPSYRTTKRNIWLSTIAAWAVIFAIVGGGLYGVPEAVALAGITIPSMIVLIAAMLGIHRFSGAIDFRSTALRSELIPSPSPYHPRDDPAGGPEGDR